MLESRTSNGGGDGGGRPESGSGSGVLILMGEGEGEGGDDNDNDANGPRDIQRGWDWRKGMGPNSTGDDALRILRLGLARDISRGWLEGEV